ncbi:MAG TPA: hypothetical protein VIT91_14590 [Chthoniobacterales bacterium]
MRIYGSLATTVHAIEPNPWRSHDLARAEKLLTEGLARTGLSEKEWSDLKGRDLARESWLWQRSFGKKRRRFKAG